MTKLKAALESMLDIEQRLLYLANVFDAAACAGATADDFLERVEQASARLDAVGSFGNTEHHRLMLRAALDGVKASAARLDAAFAALPSFQQVDAEARAALMALPQAQSRRTP